MAVWVVAGVWGRWLGVGEVGSEWRKRVVRVCVGWGPCVRPCVRPCERACVRVYVCAYVRACVCVSVILILLFAFLYLESLAITLRSFSTCNVSVRVFKI